MKDLTDVIHELVALFDRMSLPYAIMGGIAVRAYGVPRPTYDVDFTLAVPRGRLCGLFAAVEEIGYSIPTAYKGGWVDQVGGMPLVKIRLYLDGKGIDADVFLAETAFQQEVIARRVTCAVEGRQVSLVTADDLILFKLIASRPRDLIDVQDVLFTQGDLDEAYMRRWAALAAAARQTIPNRWIASGFINEGSERATGYTGFSGKAQISAPRRLNCGFPAAIWLGFRIMAFGRFSPIFPPPKFLLRMPCLPVIVLEGVREHTNSNVEMLTTFGSYN